MSKLTNLYQALVLLDNGIGDVAGFDKLVALPFTVTDPSGSTLMWAEQAVLEEVGDNSLGLAVGTRDFTFYAPHGLEVNIDGTELAVLKSDIEKEMSKHNNTLKGCFHTPFNYNNYWRKLWLNLVKNPTLPVF